MKITISVVVFIQLCAQFLADPITVPSCITSCSGQRDGYYQSCKGCRFYATCSNGNLNDQRLCSGSLVWDDKLKRCEWTSTTCGNGTNDPSCITSCAGLSNGDYQSCRGCRIFATCSNERLYDQRPCPSGLVWDDKLKRCEWKSTTCATGANKPNTNPSCIRSCAGRANGDYQSCKGCWVYATCSNGNLYDQRPCRRGLVWDDRFKRCEWKSTTCTS